MNRKIVMSLLGVLFLAVGTYVAYAAFSSGDTGVTEKAKIEAVSNESGSVSAHGECSYSKKASSYSSEECAKACESKRAAYSDCEGKSKSDCDWHEKQADKEEAAISLK